MAKLTLQPMTYLDETGVRELSKVGPIREYRKWDAEMSLSPFQVLADGERIGTVAVRGEIRPDGRKVFVIVAASVREDRSILLGGLEIIRRMALAGGYSFIRAHVYRPRVIDLFLSRGAVPHFNFATEREYQTFDRELIAAKASRANPAVMVWSI